MSIATLQLHPLPFIPGILHKTQSGRPHSSKNATKEKKHTIGNFMSLDATARFLFRMGWRNGVKRRNTPKSYNRLRPPKSQRPQGHHAAHYAFQREFKLGRFAESK